MSNAIYDNLEMNRQLKHNLGVSENINPIIIYKISPKKRNMLVEGRCRLHNYVACRSGGARLVPDFKETRLRLPTRQDYDLYELS